MKKHTRALICMMAVLSLFGTAGITGTQESVFCGVVYADTSEKLNMDVDPPQKKKNLTCSGAPQQLLKKGTLVNEGVRFDEFKHYYVSMSNDIIPQNIAPELWVSAYQDAKAIGPGVFYVYYMVEGNDDYNTYYCSQPVSVEITGEAVNRITYSLPVPYDDLTYTGEALELCSPIIVEDPSQDEVVIEYSLDDINWSREIPKAIDVGEYLISYRIRADGYVQEKGTVPQKAIISELINTETYTFHEGEPPRSIYEPGYSDYYTGDSDGKKYRKKSDDTYYLVEDDDKFYNVPYFVMEKVGNTFAVAGYNGTDEDIIIPEKYRVVSEDSSGDGYTYVPITKVKANAFAGKSIKTATLCNIVAIEEGAFSNCSSLETVVSEAGLRTIDSYAFDGSGLKNLIILSNENFDMIYDHTMPSSADIYVLSGSLAENAFAESRYIDQSHLHTLSWVWNGDECALVVTNHASGETEETIPAAVTSDGTKYTASAEFKGAVLTTEKAVPLNVATEMQMTASSVNIELDIYITVPTDAENIIVTVDGNEVTSDSNIYTADLRSAAKDMGKTHTIKVMRGDETVFEKTVSPADYLKALIADDSYSEYHATAKAMLCYCAAAQKYFGTDAADGLVNEGVDGAEFSTLDSVNTLHDAPKKADIDNALVTAGLSDDLEYNSMNMSFTADTSLLIAFRMKDPSKANETEESLRAAAVSDMNTSVYPDKSGKYLILKVENIPVKSLGNTVVTIGGLGIKGTALIDKVITQNTDEKAVLLCKGLYAYYLSTLPTA